MPIQLAPESMPSIPSILRRHQRLSILIAICIILSLSFSDSYSNPRTRITNVARQRLKHLQSLYITSGDYARDENEWEIHLGSVDYDAYVRDIQHSWRTLIGHDSGWLFRNGASGLVPLECVSEWLDIGSQPTSWSTEGQIPYRLYNTAKVPPSEFPPQFEGWAKLNPGLSFQYLNDSAMDTYLNDLFPSPSPMFKLLSSVRKPVLKADILRYSLLLRDGGIYTDIDTASIRPFKEWGTIGANDLTDSLLKALPFYLGDSPTTQNSPPGVIVSFETSAIDTEWKSKTLVRGVQVVQWTIAAKSCHPIFIDVLARIVKKYEDAIKQQSTTHTASLDDTLDVLDWTGPGVFTDAVIRYMIARHGVYPRQVSSMNVPVRVGDLLIFPARSFAAWASDGPPMDQYSSVWHGFFGSWKPHARGSSDSETDPLLQRRSKMESGIEVKDA